MTGKTPLLLQPDDLEKALRRDDLRVLDAAVFLEPARSGYRAVSGRERYREGHVPGAAFMDLIDEFSDQASNLPFTRPPPAALAAALGRLGIGAEHQVVVYSSAHVMWATRAFWLLRYAGHERVSVLDGGLRGWRHGRDDAPRTGEVAGGDEHYPPTAFSAKPRPELFADLEATRAAMGDAGVCTVNALSPEVYAGTGEVHYGRRGHIPGSRNLHYDRLLDGAFFRPPAELRAVLTAAGLRDRHVISYCGGGISATIDAFACLLVGHHDVAVYDGSMSEWARDESLPLTTGSEP